MIYKKLALAVTVTLGLQTGFCFAAESHNTHSHPTHWGYEDNAANHWGHLAEEYATCAAGKLQSPIDIISADAEKADLPVLEFDYKEIGLNIQNNGHTIKINGNEAGTLKIGDDIYSLLQFHSHAPSEGAIDGKRADMVIHLVHQNSDKELAVVAIYLEAKVAANSLIETLWKVMPTTAGEPQQHELKIDLNQLLPADKNYYTFAGSLTTPPCTEGVRWVVLKQAVSISTEQLSQYHSLYSGNDRPLQDLNERKVQSSN